MPFVRALPELLTLAARHSLASHRRQSRSYKIDFCVRPMSNQRYQSFAEFWPFYVAEHSRPATRVLHFIGTTIGVALVIYFIAIYNVRSNITTSML